MITFGVTASDIALRYINKAIIERIGYRTISQETRDLMTSTFIQ